MSAPLVLKFGGELLEDPSRLRTVVSAVAAKSREKAFVKIVTD